VKTPSSPAGDRVRRLPRLLLLAATLGAAAAALYIGGDAETGTQALRECPDWACGQNHNQVLL
jgi:hypothetical protein